MKIETLRRILRHANHFGPRGGWQAAQMFRAGGRLMRVQVPGVAHALRVRTGEADIETFEEIFLTRQYDLPFDDFSPRHILDLGANVGYASVYFATRWPAARIVAVEPVAENFTLLVSNTEPLPAISCVRGAVWPCVTELEVVNPGDAANAFRFAATSAGTRPAAPAVIAATTVPELLNRFADGECDLVKMDIEGAEAEVLRDGAPWLDRVGVLVVELHDRVVAGCTEALMAALQGRHYRMEILGSNLAFDFR